MESHARQIFTSQIHELEHDLLEMGSRAEFMVGLAVEALVKLDPVKAYEVIEKDDEVDQIELAIEAMCIKMLALQQPMASDLRVVGTAMKMITDIERMADLAVDIAKVSLKIEKELGKTGFIDLQRMGNLARAMFREALEAYVKRDLDLVQSVAAKDDEVDNLYRELRGQIHEHMRANPDEVVSASWLLLAIHHIERIADHAVNIAERVNFMVTGHFEKLRGEVAP